MKRIVGFTIAGFVLLVGGCATRPQPPLNLSEGSLGSQAGRVGIAMTQLPKVDTYLRGASCLLCMAAASVANASLTSHAQTLPKEDLPKLKEQVAELLRKKGTDVTIVAEDLNIEDLPDHEPKAPNVANKNFTRLGQKYNVDKLLVISITSLGFLRTYSAYIPTSPPKGLLEGVGYMVNLKTNNYEWYERVTIIKSADGNWDEPPQFPGLTNAYFQTLELGKDSFLRTFGN
jgi:hypothetical protein